MVMGGGFYGLRGLVCGLPYGVTWGAKDGEVLDVSEVVGERRTDDARGRSEVAVL